MTSVAPVKTESVIIVMSFCNFSLKIRSLSEISALSIWFTFNITNNETMINATNEDIAAIVYENSIFLKKSENEVKVNSWDAIAGINEETIRDKIIEKITAINESTENSINIGPIICHLCPPFSW